MLRLLVLAAILITSLGPVALAQDAARNPLKEYLGAWINNDIWDKASSCRAIAQGGDDDGMLVINESTFRIYLPQSPCRITKSQKLSESSVSIEAQCGGRLVKETWHLNRSALERRTAQNVMVTYVRCRR